MPKKENWEIMYEEYKKNSYLTIEELEREWKSQDEEYRRRLSEISDSNSQEYKQIKRERNKAKREFNNKKHFFSNIRKNESKIEQIKKDRDIYQELLDEILGYRDENRKREQDISDLEKEAEGLEREAAELDKELEELKYIEEHLNIALKNPEVPEEKKAELTILKKENIKKQDRNSKAFSKNREAFSKNQMALKEKVKTPIKEYLEEDIVELEEKIARANKMCELLVEGKSIGEIQEALNTSRKSKETKKQEPVRTKQTATEQTEKEQTVTEQPEIGTTVTEQYEKEVKINGWLDILDHYVDMEEDLDKLFEEILKSGMIEDVLEKCYIFHDVESAVQKLLEDKEFEEKMDICTYDDVRTILKDNGVRFDGMLLTSRDVFYCLVKTGSFENFVNKRIAIRDEKLQTKNEQPETGSTETEQTKAGNEQTAPEQVEPEKGGHTESTSESKDKVIPLSEYIFTLDLDLDEENIPTGSIETEQTNASQIETEQIETEQANAGQTETEKTETELKINAWLQELDKLENDFSEEKMYALLEEICTSGMIEEFCEACKVSDDLKEILSTKLDSKKTGTQEELKERFDKLCDNLQEIGREISLQEYLYALGKIGLFDFFYETYYGALKDEQTKSEQPETGSTETEQTKAGNEQTAPEQVEPEKVVPTKTTSKSKEKSKDLSGDDPIVDEFSFDFLFDEEDISTESKKEISKVIVNPLKDRTTCYFYDTEDGKKQDPETLLKLNYRNIAEILKILKTNVPSCNWDLVADAIDPNIVMAISDNGGNEQLEKYYKALSGKKSDLKIEYNLKNIYNSDLSNKQIKNIRRIAKSAKKRNKSAIKVVEDSLIERIIGNIKKMIKDSNIKGLIGNKKQEKAKKSIKSKKARSAITNNKKQKNNTKTVKHYKSKKSNILEKAKGKVKDLKKQMNNWVPKAKIDHTKAKNDAAKKAKNNTRPKTKSK